jgi:predicted transposase YbfD/YdcC
VESIRCTKKGQQSSEKHYYLSSMEKTERSAQGWIELIRNHWGGVENRNHWRKDACWHEDGTRSRNKNIVGVLALLRNALLAIVADHQETYQSLPVFSEACEHSPAFALRLIRSSI